MNPAAAKNSETFFDDSAKFTTNLVVSDHTS